MRQLHGMIPRVTCLVDNLSIAPGATRRLCEHLAERVGRDLGGATARRIIATVSDRAQTKRVDSRVCSQRVVELRTAVRHARRVTDDDVVLLACGYALLEEIEAIGYRKRVRFGRKLVDTEVVLRPL